MSSFLTSRGHPVLRTARKYPRPIYDHDIPVLVASVGLPQPGRSQRTTTPRGAEQQNLEHMGVDYENPFEVDMYGDWDPTTRKLLPFINSYNHVLKIAADTNVEQTLVKSCIENLLIYGVVVLIPVLRFNNPYRATPNFNRLLYEHKLQELCRKFIIKDANSRDKPSLSDVIEVFNSLQQGSSLRAVCEKYSNRGPTFDIRRLVAFAQMHGLIKCLNIYPVYFPNPARINGFANQVDFVMGIRRLFTGRLSTDEICCIARIDLPTLEQIIGDDPNVSVIWR